MQDLYHQQYAIVFRAASLGYMWYQLDGVAFITRNAKPLNPKPRGHDPGDEICMFNLRRAQLGLRV